MYKLPKVKEKRSNRHFSSKCYFPGVKVQIHKYCKSFLRYLNSSHRRLVWLLSGGEEGGIKSVMSLHALYLPVM